MAGPQKSPRFGDLFTDSGQIKGTLNPFCASYNMEISILLHIFNCGGRGKYNIIMRPQRGNSLAK